jgi:hypothetical protein
MEVSARILDRFWPKTKRNQQTGCLEWTGARSKSGYGNFWIGYEQGYEYAHRFAWRIYKGIWPTKFICHHCDNRLCVEESHLFEGDAKINSDDARAKDRLRGCKHALTWHERNLVRLALADKRLTQKSIAEIFETSQYMVQKCAKFIYEPRA